MIKPSLLLVLSLVALATGGAQAATISVTTADARPYEKIEAAQAGDEVVIAPGTYATRVHLTKAGTADKPIIIRALEPANPPIWDPGDKLVENAPGSYTAGDRGRGCWQISGGQHYQISGMVFRNCHNAGNNSAGLRYYNGARGIRLRDCVFRDNDNGLTGGTGDSEITVEYAELDGNGNTAASAPTHNLYIYGGTFTLRYSYVHDPKQAQNFHIRATNAVIEYNWFARAKSYEGDLMSSDDLSDPSAVRQVMLLRGNVIVQNAQPDNRSQVIAVYNDGEVAGLSFTLRMVNNTFVGNGGKAALVHLSNADGTVMRAELVNNIVAGTSVVTVVDDPTSGSVSGGNNWIVSNASASGLLASISGTEPGFANAGNKDFTLAAGSAAIGKATVTNDPPTSEYYRDEQTSRQSRTRGSASDLGAFESTTTSVPTGPYGAASSGPLDGGADAPLGIDAPPAGTGGSGAGGSTRFDGSVASGGRTGTDAARSDAAVAGTGGMGGSSMGGAGAGGTSVTPGAGGQSGPGPLGTGGATGQRSSSSGCGCALGGRASGASGWWLLGLLAPGWLRPRTRPRR